MDKEQLRKFMNMGIWGAVLIIFFGSAWHFAYNWSGKNALIGLISPVNESVWEHMKLSIIPFALFGIADYLFLRDKKSKNFFLSHVSMQIACIVFIIAFFYIYNVFTAGSLFWDILSYILGIVLGRYIFYIMIKKHVHFRYSEIVASLLLAALGIFVIVATYNPPHKELFKDSQTGEYGIGM